MVGVRRGDADLVSVVRVGPETDPAPVPRVPKAWAGVSTQVLLPELAKALGVDARSGLRVTQLVPGGAADKAGLRVGDILLRLDGKVIPARRPEDAEWFGSTLREYDPAAKVTIDLLRDGKPAKVELPLAERPAPPSELPTVRDLRLGFSARALAFDDRQERRLADTERGVVVTRVERSGWADLAGLRSADILTEVNGRPVTSNEDLRAVLESLAAERPRHVVFRVRRGVTGSILECEPDWAALAAAEAR
jgi:serine protease Do